MGKDQKGFIVYGDTKSLADELTDEQLGQLFRGMLGYFVEGKEPKFTGVLKFAFIPIKQQMDRDKEKYDAKCEKNRAKIQKYWNDVKANTNEYNGIPMYTNATNTKTNTDTNTKTNTDTNTKTNTKTNTDTDTDTTTDTKTNVGGGVYNCDDSFNIWKKLTPDDIDRIYDIYPESGGLLIDEVFTEVKAKQKAIKDPVAYILGYARNKGWDDSAESAQ